MVKRETIIEAPAEEQEICVRCGFCCDGTLFLHANLHAGERGHLPEKIEAAAFTDNGREYFRLPCGYFSDRCTIYDRPRAEICGTYRCGVLRSFAAGEITREEAHDIVARAFAMRDSLYEDYSRLTNSSRRVCFRQMLTELGKREKSEAVRQVNKGDKGEVLPQGDRGLDHFSSAEDLTSASDGGGLAPASSGAGLTSASDGGGLAPASSGAGLTSASDGGGLAPASSGAGLAPASDGGGLASASSDGGLTPASDGGGNHTSKHPDRVGQVPLRTDADLSLLTDDEADLLIARCNIFETLLIKYFRSADDFGKLVMR